MISITNLFEILDKENIIKIYTLNSDANNYQNLIFKNEKDYDILEKFNGTQIKNWKPLKVLILRDNKLNKNLLKGDFPSLIPHIPVFSKKAVDVLYNQLQNNGQLLPLECSDGKYFAYNVTKINNSLDEKKSKIYRFQSSNRIMKIDNYEFHKNLIGNEFIFKLKQVPKWEVFVNEEFVKSVLKNKLAGFKFNLVWSV